MSDVGVDVAGHKRGRYSRLSDLLISYSDPTKFRYRHSERNDRGYYSEIECLFEISIPT